MFLGTYQQHCSNGRIIFPRKFRLGLEDQELACMLVRSDDLFLFVAAQSHISNPIHLNSFPGQQVDFSLSFSCALDAQGRISIPVDFARKIYGEASFEATFVGMGEYFEIWNRLDWDTFGAMGSFGSSLQADLQRLMNSAAARTVRRIPGGPRVFISYSHRDQAAVHRIAKRLEQWGCNVLLDSWKLVPGDSLHESIGAAIAKADVVLCFLSRSASKSKWMREEIKEALYRRDSKRSKVIIIPCLLNDVEAPAFLHDYIYCDLYDNFSLGIRRLAVALRSSFHLDGFDTILKRMAELDEDVRRLSQTLGLQTGSPPEPGGG